MSIAGEVICAIAGFSIGMIVGSVRGVITESIYQAVVRRK